MKKSKSKIFKSYWALCALRISLVLLPQTGYIHPDEYFQSSEVFASEVFEIEGNIPWDFNVTFPIRSVGLQCITTGLSYRVLKTFNVLLNGYFKSLVTPYSLVVAPRSLICCLSFLCDWSLYKICVNNNEKYKSKLLVLASSYVTLVFGGRTFTNTLELILFSLLLFYVAESMIFSNVIIRHHEYLRKRYEKSKTPAEKAKFHKLRSVRSQGEFLESERAVKIIRLRNLQNFGYRNKMGVFLNLEEALYLLETNRLEILWNNVSISIQQGYNLFLDNRLTLHKYRMYKKLVSEGFKVHRFKNSVEEPPTKRIKLDETGIGDKTKEDVNEYVAKDETQVEEITGSLNIKGNPVSCTREDLKNKTNKKIVEFFKKLQNKVPKKCDNTILENDPVYTCTTSKRIDKNINCDVYLVQEEMDPGIGFCKENNKNLFAVISNDDIPFYRFSRVSLPNLLEKEDK